MIKKIHNFFFTEYDDMSTKVLFYGVIAVSFLAVTWGFFNYGN